MTTENSQFSSIDSDHPYDYAPYATVSHQKQDTNKIRTMGTDFNTACKQQIITNNKNNEQTMKATLLITMTPIALCLSTKSMCTISIHRSHSTSNTTLFQGQAARVHTDHERTLTAQGHHWG